QLALLAAIGAHEPDFVVIGVVAYKSNPLAVGRPDRVVFVLVKVSDRGNPLRDRVRHIGGGDIEIGVAAPLGRLDKDMAAVVGRPLLFLVEQVKLAAYRFGRRLRLAAVGAHHIDLLAAVAGGAKGDPALEVG